MWKSWNIMKWKTATRAHFNVTKVVFLKYWDLGGKRIKGPKFDLPTYLVSFQKIELHYFTLMAL